MTVTRSALPASTSKARRTSAYKWVPAAAGWTVGIIATLSLIASVSPLVRSLIRVPREFVNDYIFNFPDTSFAWAFVLALLAAALAARKSIAWWILVGYMVAAIGWNIGDLVTGEETWMEESGEIIGLVCHVAFVALLVLARKEFWAKVRRGALLKAAAALVAAHGGRHARRVGPARAVPRDAGPRRPVPLRVEPGQRVRRCLARIRSPGTRTYSSTPCWACSERSP